MATPTRAALLALATTHIQFPRGGRWRPEHYGRGVDLALCGAESARPVMVDRTFARAYAAGKLRVNPIALCPECARRLSWPRQRVADAINADRARIGETQ